MGRWAVNPLSASALPLISKSSGVIQSKIIKSGASGHNATRWVNMLLMTTAPELRILLEK